MSIKFDILLHILLLNIYAYVDTYKFTNPANKSSEHFIKHTKYFHDPDTLIYNHFL
jgi:hypothetical protein